MDLKGLIRPKLWSEISNSYVAENYKIAILDAFRCLTNVVREKSGLDGDGVPLVGQAFGGEEPKLRINKLQTISEKDEQRGYQQVLTGLYSAIRNPRTHEDIEDDKNVADPIIYFINYLLTILEEAKPPFTSEDFLKRVYDKDFVERREYAEELVKEIPANKYVETLIEIYRLKENGEGKKLAFVFSEIFTKLSDAEIEEFAQVISDELDFISEESKITKILQILPPNIWPKLKKTARMRIETKLIVSVKGGDAFINQEKIRQGAFGTWATNIMDYFTLKDDLKAAISNRLFSGDPENALYIFKFFMRYLPSLYQGASEIDRVVHSMHDVLERGDSAMIDRISSFSYDAPDAWLSSLKKVFRDFTDEENPKFYLRDGTPLLGKDPPSGEDDIPF
jgi:uncharacterized protein (TIGR02391 family)